MMTQSATERNEHLRERWLAEFGGHALAALVDQAMAECPVKNGGLGGRYDRMRMTFGMAYQAATVDEQIEWAHRLDKDILTFEEFEEREIGI